ncbi:MAG: hypothetical protein RLZZ142_214 [Verrucomicrobiota bacterium]|jgi:hypothetical protein
MKSILPLLCVLASAPLTALNAAESSLPLFVEAESFQSHGGWALDTSFTQIVGSPYLLAHGLGKPVADATHKITVPSAGNYRVWVRTKDWVAPWKASGTPGRFQLLVNGKPLAVEFGTQGAEWHWQSGGSVDLPAGEVSLALHDLTGFEGRCDAILLSKDAGYTPPDGAALAQARKAWLNPGGKPEDAGEFDLVVCGGGYAGLGAAISAARQSLKVALIQDRFVLGGNGSSEIGVWAMGGTMRGKYPHVGEIVEEFADRAPDSPGAAKDFVDELKEKVCRKEKNLTLYLGHFVHGAVTDRRDGRMQSVIALDVKTGREREFRGKFFVDCTGHGTVGALAGAKFSMEEKGHMGTSNMWFYQQEDTPQAWPATPWALALEPGDFPPLVKSKSQIEGKPFMKGEWFWESGFDKHPIEDLERIRDWNFRALYGAFSALKTKEEHANAALKWVSHVGGPRESRRLEGDVILTQEDIAEGKEYADGFVPTTWDIDLHYPREQYAKKTPDNPFISRAEFGKHVDRKNGYPVPYRCFYSKNVPNLFMAGRNISVTHQALGTVRVMRTCGMMGEVVGKAAYLAVLHKTDPRGVYEKHLPELTELVKQPGATRRDSLTGELHPDLSIEDFRKLPVHRTNRSLPAYASTLYSAAEGVPVRLPGVVVDDSQAKLEGKWASSSVLFPQVGGGYVTAAPSAKAVARYEFSVPKNGNYEVWVYWAPDEKRASNAPCVLERPAQEPVNVRLNQREPAGPQGAYSIGKFAFEAGKVNAVVLRSEGADAAVHADAVQVVAVP